MKNDALERNRFGNTALLDKYREELSRMLHFSKFTKYKTKNIYNALAETNLAALLHACLIQQLLNKQE